MRYIILFLVLLSLPIFGISRSEIIEVIKNDIYNSYDVDSVDVEIYSPKKTVDSFVGKKFLMISQQSHGLKNHQRYKLICDGYSKSITVKVDFYKNIPVAREFIDKNSIVSKEDIEYRLMKISSKNAFVRADEKVIGKLTKRTFKKGSYFQEASLKEVPLVIKDRDVTVVVENSLINLSFEAKAFNSGYAGERIYFRNPFNGELQLGTVVALNLIKL